MYYTAIGVNNKAFIRHLVSAATINTAGMKHTSLRVGLYIVSKVSDHRDHKADIAIIIKMTDERYF